MCVWVCGAGEGKELGGTFRKVVNETKENDKITLRKGIILTTNLRNKVRPYNL